MTAKRKRNQKRRTRLQKKGTKSATRLLRKRSGKESRFVADVNHRVSKTIVAEAKHTGRGIAVEDLTGIRDRYGNASPNGPRSTPGRSRSSGSSWPTRPRPPGSSSSRS